MNSDLHQLQRVLALSLHGLDANQTQLRPPTRPGNWSIQQIVEHLLLSYSGTETAIASRLIKRTPTSARPTLKHRLGQYLVLRLGYLPSGRKAPALVTPQPTEQALTGEDLAHATADHLARLDLLFTEAEHLFGPTSPCIRHMALGPLSIQQWCRFQLVHGKHHVKQILSIRQSHNLPPTPV
jgi:hypothetical protein